MGKDFLEEEVKDLGRPASNRAPYSSGCLGPWGEDGVAWLIPPRGSHQREVARGRKTQKKMETQRAAVGDGGVDLSLRRQRRTWEQRNG